MQTDRQTPACGIVVALYRGKVVARWGASRWEPGGTGGHRMGREPEDQGPTRGRGKLAKAGGKLEKIFEKTY